jgi:hypothetical protein
MEYGTTNTLRGLPNQDGREDWRPEDLRGWSGWKQGRVSWSDGSEFADDQQDLEHLLAHKRGEIPELPEPAPVIEGDRLLTFLRGRLVEIDRVLLVLRDQGLSQEEISQIIGYPQPTISTRLRSVREWSDRVSHYLRPVWERWGLAALPFGDLEEGPEIPEGVSGFDRLILRRIVWQLRKPAHFASEAAPYFSTATSVAVGVRARNHLLYSSLALVRTLEGTPWADLLRAYQVHQKENPNTHWGAPGLVSTRSSGCVPRPNPGWEHLLTGL